MARYWRSRAPPINAGRCFAQHLAPNVAFWEADPPPTEDDKLAWRTWMVAVFTPLNRQMRDQVVTKAHLINGTDMPDCLLAVAAHVSAYESILARWQTNDLSLHHPPLGFPRGELEEYVKLNFAELKARQPELLKATSKPFRH
jgi:hypothetical protein